MGYEILRVTRNSEGWTEQVTVLWDRHLEIVFVKKDGKIIEASKSSEKGDRLYESGDEMHS